MYKKVWFFCFQREEKERVRNPNGVWTAELEKDVDCPALFSNPDIDSSSVFMRPPRRVGKYCTALRYLLSVEVVNTGVF